MLFLDFPDSHILYHKFERVVIPTGGVGSTFHEKNIQN